MSTNTVCPSIDQSIFLSMRLFIASAEDTTLLPQAANSMIYY